MSDTDTPVKTTSAKRRLHCWAGGPETADGCGTTCMLPDGHPGPHAWTRDDQIRVTFPATAGETDQEFEDDDQ